MAMKRLTRDEARRIAANFAKWAPSRTSLARRATIARAIDAAATPTTQATTISGDALYSIRLTHGSSREKFRDKAMLLPQQRS
jgi:hypothetical protein